MGILNFTKKRKTRKPNLQKDLRDMKLVTRTGIESSLSHFVSFSNLPKIAILRGL